MKQCIKFNVGKDIFAEANKIGGWENTFSYLIGEGFQVGNLIWDEDIHSDSYIDEEKMVIIGARKLNIVIFSLSEETDINPVEMELFHSYKQKYKSL